VNKRPVFVGIDVSKAHLDVALSEHADVERLGNDAAGIEALVERLRPLRPQLVVMEATGGFEVPAAAALAAGGVPVVIANPRQTRDFAKSTPQVPGPLQFRGLLSSRRGPSPACPDPRRSFPIESAGTAAPGSGDPPATQPHITF
jgi:hypothetical protein